MQKSFLSNLFILLFLNLLVKPFYIFGIDTKVQNLVGETEYGSYFTLLNFSLLFNIVLDLGLVNYSISQVAKDSNWMKNNVKQIFTIRIFLAFIYFVIALMIALLLKMNVEKIAILILLLLNQIFVAVVFIVRANFAGLQRFRIDAFFSVFDRLLLIFFCLFLFYGTDLSKFKIEWFVYAQTIAYACSAIVACIWGNAVFGLIGWSFKKDEIVSIAKKCLPYSLLIFTMIAHQRLDTLMLSSLRSDGDFQVGVYAQSFRLQDGVNMFAQLFASLLLAMYANVYNDRREIQRLLIYAFKILVGAMIIGVFVAFFIRDNVLNDLYTSPHISAYAIYFWLILTLIPISMIHLYSSLLTAKGRLKEAIFSAAAAFVVCILGNLCFIPKYGALATAITSFVSMSTMAILCIYFVARFEQVAVPFLVWFKMILLGCICLVSGTIACQYFQNYIPGLIIAVVGTLTFISFGFVSKSDFREILKLKQK
jgi:O-antigen/teichoic acid export membrane protein